MTIPVANPRASYLAHRQEIDQAIRIAIDSGWYILGEEVRSFEQEFAAFVGCGFGVGVASGTDAVQLALRALGVGVGHKALTVSNTAVATVSAIDLAGATPLIVDVDPETFLIDPLQVEAELKRDPTIRAIIAVHLFGHPAPMTELLELGRQHDAAVVEDCAQAHGATLDGRPIGSMGRVSAFSFYPTKNLGALGDGGAVTTSDAAVNESLRMLRQYGWRERYISETYGMNSRLDELQAAVLRVKLRHLEAGNERRRAIASLYDRACAASGITAPVVRPGCQHAYHQYVVRTLLRDKLRAHLEERGIGTAVLYPMPIHRQPGYSSRVLMGQGGLAVTERLANEILSIPIYPELTDGEVDQIATAIHQFSPA